MKTKIDINLPFTADYEIHNGTIEWANPSCRFAFWATPFWAGDAIYLQVVVNGHTCLHSESIPLDGLTRAEWNATVALIEKDGFTDALRDDAGWRKYLVTVSLALARITQAINSGEIKLTAKG